MKTLTETNWCCFLKNFGFYKNVQNRGSIYVDFTTDITQARVYKNKRAAATALDYKNQDHPDLTYYQIERITYYPDINECE